ncbi:MAG: 50S ribosomal protein L4 [Verrucomicrobia bacterium]|nr:50S ribosomal protein L4 [Verrucomicrobiota bacterium]
MAALKKYNLAGKEVGQVAIEDELLKSNANSQMIKDYIVALRENARQWSAFTKSRAEVAHSGQKPHPQKGTGRARQGYLGAAQYKGGGRVHAPKPKFDQHVRINRKEKRAVIRHLIIEKILDNRLHVLQCDEMKAPKTKVVADFLKSRELEGKKILFLGDGLLMADKSGKKPESPTQKFESFLKSIRNIPESDFMIVPNVSGYDVVVHHDLIVMDTAIDQLKVLLGGQQ